MAIPPTGKCCPLGVILPTFRHNEGKGPVPARLGTALEGFDLTTPEQFRFDFRTFGNTRNAPSGSILLIVGVARLLFDSHRSSTPASVRPLRGCGGSLPR